MQAVGDRVQTEGGRVLAVGDQGVREEPPEHRLAAGREGVRVVHDLVAVQDAERRVQVVVARVHQVEADDRAAEELLGLVVRERTGAEAPAGQDVVRGDREVPFALVDVGRLVDVRVAVGTEPVEVDLGLGGPFRVGEPGPEDPAVHDEGPVRREDHVGQRGVGFEGLDDVPEGAVAVPQVFPLGQCEGQVHRFRGIHPRIDGVRDLEVCGCAHQVAPGCGVSAQRRLLTTFTTRDECWRESSLLHLDSTVN